MYTFNKINDIEDILIKIFVLFNKTPIDYLTISITSNKHNSLTNFLIFSCSSTLNNDNIQLGISCKARKKAMSTW